MVHQGQPAFNLRFTEPLKRVQPAPGELLHLEWRDKGVLRASFVDEPLKLPPFQGDVGGVFPVVASRDLDPSAFRPDGSLP